MSAPRTAALVESWVEHAAELREQASGRLTSDPFGALVLHAKADQLDACARELSQTEGVPMPRSA